MGDRLKGKRAFVTAAAMGIGRACALAFAREGATVIATQSEHRTVTTTDESGAYEFTGLAPGAYTVEVQMFGFQAARKQIQVGPGSSPSQAPAEWSLDLQPLRREPREVGQRPQQQPRGFRATAGTTENELDQIAASTPQDITAQAPGNANEAFLVNGSLSNGLQTGQDDFGLRGPAFGIQNPGGLPGAGVEGQPGGVPGTPGGPGGGGLGGQGAGQGAGGSVTGFAIGDPQPAAQPSNFS